MSSEMDGMVRGHRHEREHIVRLLVTLLDEAIPFHARVALSKSQCSILSRRTGKRPMVEWFGQSVCVGLLTVVPPSHDSTVTDICTDTMAHMVAIAVRSTFHVPTMPSLVFFFLDPQHDTAQKVSMRCDSRLH